MCLSCRKLMTFCCDFKMEPMAKRWTNRTAFVTGGDSGIEAAIVTRLIDMGVNVASFDENIVNLEVSGNNLIRVIYGTVKNYQTDNVSSRRFDIFNDTFSHVNKKKEMNRENNK